MRLKGYIATVIFIASLIPSALFAADVVPFSIQSIRSIQSIQSKGSGYVELVGPGEIKVNGKTLPYSGTKYIRASSIGTLSGVKGTTKGCMLAYSSEGYTENISVAQQSCNQVLSTIESTQ